MNGVEHKYQISSCGIPAHFWRDQAQRDEDEEEIQPRVREVVFGSRKESSPARPMECSSELEPGLESTKSRSQESFDT